MYKKNPIKNVDYIHDYYHYLGVDVSVNQEELKAAYKKKSKEYHPDRVATLGDEIKNVSNRLYPLIVEGYKLLSDPTLKPLYDENLKYFNEKKPSLVSKDGYAMIDLTIESIDLDFLLSDNEEYPGQANFRDKYEKLSGYNEATFNVIRNAYLLTPDNEQLKKAYFEQMTQKNVYLNLKEMESYMGIGVINKKDVPVIGVFGYLGTIESELDKIGSTYEKTIDMRLLAADSQPILIGMDQKELSGDLVEIKNAVSLKLKEEFDKRKQRVLDVAKEKQEFLAEYVKIREFDQIQKLDTKSVEVIVIGEEDSIVCSIKVEFANDEYQPAQFNGEFSKKKLTDIDVSHFDHNVYWLKWNREVSFNIFVMEFINDICNDDL